jgi:hypothetical protein
MFRAPMCPSSGALEYYTSGCCLSYLVLGFQVVGMMWNWGLCVRFAGAACCCTEGREGKVIYSVQLCTVICDHRCWSGSEISGIRKSSICHFIYTLTDVFIRTTNITYVSRLLDRSNLKSDRVIPSSSSSSSTSCDHRKILVTYVCALWTLHLHSLLARNEWAILGEDY